MDGPDNPKQNPELYRSRYRRSRNEDRRLRPSESHRQLSQLPPGRIGGIKSEDRPSACWQQSKESPMEVEMTIRGLLLDPVSNMPIVILKDVAGEAVLPIWVGVYEANAIALEMEKVSTPRPMTHDLIKNVLTGLETHVHKVVVTELREDTFFAVIWLERGGEVVSIDW